MTLISFKGTLFHYDKADRHFSLDIPDYGFEKNKSHFLVGPSGSGKTSFLNLVTGMLSPQEGRIDILGTTISQLSLPQRDQFRADHFGIIFQVFNLLPYLSIIENIILPCSFSRLRKANVLKQAASLESEAKRLCKALDLSDDLLHHPVSTLSIGQQQRVAIARALIGKPEIIIADEPTSALDENRKKQFIDLLTTECTQHQTTLLFVSHDRSLDTHFDITHDLTQVNKGYQDHVI